MDRELTMKKIPLLAICAMTLSTSLVTVRADDISYNYAQVGYSFVNDSDITGGVSLSASYDVYENINLLGNLFASTSSDSAVAEDINAKVYSLGVGYHSGLTEKTDLLTELSLLNSHSSISIKGGGKTKINNTGHIISIGTRTQLNEKMELLLRADKRNSSDPSGTVFSIGAVYKLNNKAALVGSLNTGASDGSEVVTTSVRWNLD